MIDKIKNYVDNLSAILLLAKNQYTFDVHPTATKTEVKHCIEMFFRVKVVSMNSYKPPNKFIRMRSPKGRPIRYKRMIVTVQSGECIKIL
jgi:large subunit ribosomal protein L23